MKNGNSKLAIGAIIGFMLGGITVAGANQAIQAIQNTQIKVKLNGVNQTFKDEATGEIQYPITYHDRTYLPLRNVAQLSGLDVDWDSETNTAILNSNKNESIEQQDNNQLISTLFESKFKFTNDSVETALGQIAGTITYTIDNDTLIKRSVTAPDVNVADAIDETEVIKSNTNKKIIGLANGYTVYIPEVLVKFEDGTYGIVAYNGEETIESLDAKKHMILGNSYGEYTNELKNAVLIIGPTSPENNYGIRINYTNNKVSPIFTTGNENIELDTENELILFPTAMDGSYKTDNVEKIKYEINNYKISKLTVEFKDGEMIEFFPDDNFEG